MHSQFWYDKIIYGSEVRKALGTETTSLLSQFLDVDARDRLLAR